MSRSLPEFRELYEAHFAFVWRSLRRLGAREADVSDLAQKVFLTAHSKLGEFEGRSGVKTWLFGICQRVASDYRRSARIRREIATDVAELDLVSSDAATAPELADSGRLSHVAETILNKLPEPQRVVFVLFELEELSGQEIAALLDVPVGTVRSRLRLARDAFRREVKRLALSNGRKEAV